MKVAALAGCMMRALLAARVHAAAVTCEQPGEIAYITERLRDNGTPLADVMADADRLESDKKFGGADIEKIRETIHAAFNRIRNTNETLLECRKKIKR
jgi:flagellar motility protein MotE (MotC chaperone)